MSDFWDKALARIDAKQPQRRLPPPTIPQPEPPAPAPEPSGWARPSGLDNAAHRHSLAPRSSMEQQTPRTLSPDALEAAQRRDQDWEDVRAIVQHDGLRRAQPGFTATPGEVDVGAIRQQTATAGLESPVSGACGHGSGMDQGWCLRCTRRRHSPLGWQHAGIRLNSGPESR
jgi:hypothetical protein